MRVNCGNCNTNFNLDESLVKPSGSKVRCSKCKHIFIVYPPQREEETPADVLADAGEQTETSFDEFESGAREDFDSDASEAVDASEADESLFGEDSEEESETESQTDDMDLSDIEKMLEVEQGSEVPPAEAEDGISQEDIDSGDEEESLDLTDIEKILDEADDSDELADEKNDDDQDLVFDLDEELELKAGEEQISPTTELDLGDLEKMFEAGEDLEASMDEEMPMSSDLETDEGGLSLAEDTEEVEISDELESDADEETPALEAEDVGEALGFDMESVEEEDQVDLSGEEDTPSEEETAMLGLEWGGEDLSPMEEPEITDEETDNIDLGLVTELEPETSELTAEEVEPEEISIEDISEMAGEEEPEIFLEEKSELTLEGQDEGFEDVGGISSESLKRKVDGEQLADFGEEDMDFPDDAIPDIPDEDETFMDETVGIEETLEEEVDEEMEMEKVSTGGVKKVVLRILAALLVVILVLAALIFLQYKGIIHDVPYLDRLNLPFLTQKTTQVTDFGNLHIGTSDVEYRYLDSEKAGRMFIVTGKVKNNYSEPRSYIQLTSSVYTKGQTKEDPPADTATAYSGNIIADLELSQMTPAAIRTRLGNRSGENNSNVNVAPGEERPFMIVFFNLPASMDWYSLTVVGSSSGGK